MPHAHFGPLILPPLSWLLTLQLFFSEERKKRKVDLKRVRVCVRVTQAEAGRPASERVSVFSLHCRHLLKQSKFPPPLTRSHWGKEVSSRAGGQIASLCRDLFPIVEN